MKAGPAIWLMAIWVLAWAAFSLPWTSATTTAQWDRFTPPYVRSYSRIKLDHILNVVFYLPVAPLGAAFGWPLSAGVTAGAAMSAAAESSQVFSSDRAPNGNDFIANVAGAAVGAAGFFLYRRRARR